MAIKVSKALRITGIVLITLIVAGVVSCAVLDRPLPDGVAGEKAEAIADKVLEYVNASAWEDTPVVQFTFLGQAEHAYVWDKNRELAQISWGDVKVLLDLKTKQGIVWDKDKQLSKEAAQPYLEDAWAYWCNDTFWLNPLVKVRDEGTSRYYVTLEGPQDGLLVTYNSGGVTPGDSYLWYVNPDGQPTHWRMWVSVIPVGGIEVPWENWKTLSTGAKVAQSHGGNALLGVRIANLKAAESVEALVGRDVFAPLVNPL